AAAGALPRSLLAGLDPDRRQPHPLCDAGSGASLARSGDQLAAVSSLSFGHGSSPVGSSLPPVGREFGSYLKMTAISEQKPPAAPPPAQRYFERAGDHLGPPAEQEPVCLYLETTNRCNLLCVTCPRTFEALEPPADMSWELFTSIVDQFPRIARVVL